MDLLILSICGVGLGIAYILEKKLSAEPVHPATLSLLESVMSTVFAAPLLLYHPRAPLVSPIWLVALLSVTVYGLGLMSNYAAYKTIDASVVGLIQRLNLVVAAVAGIVLFSETHTVPSYIGLLLIILGSVVIMCSKGKFRISRGIVFAIFAAVGIGLSAAFDKIVLTQFSPFTYVFVNNLLVTLFFLPYRRARRNMITLWKRKSLLVSSLAFFGVANWAGFLWVLQRQPVSTAFPIFDSLGLVVIVLLGVTLLGEKDRLIQKILGSIVVIIGVFLLG